MKFDKPTVSINIPAYNEQQNIGLILKSLLNQDQKNYYLKHITIYADGCTDNTVQIIQKFQHQYPSIKVKISSQRHGKIYWLNYIFSRTTEDILIIFDADIGISHPYVVSNLVDIIQKDSHANMVAAHQSPLKPKNNMGKIIYSCFYVWDCIRLTIKNHDHVQNFYGAATAYRRTFAKYLHIPDEFSDERVYLYAKAKQTNSFRYCLSAEVIYWPMTTFKDFILMYKRSFGKENQYLDQLLGISTTKMCAIPLKNKFIGSAEAFFHHPISTFIALGLLTYINLVGTGSTNPIINDIISSSKKPIQL